MYANDNSGKIVPNGGQANTPSTFPDPRLLPGAAWYQWCPGNMDAYSPYATNFVQAGAIYQYVNTMIYKCPGDFAVFKFGPISVPHARSYSMNCYLSPIAGDSWTSVGLDGTRNFYKDSDDLQPGPSMTYVLIDENEHSINDAFFVSDPTQGNYWQDVPATRHGASCGLSYADGHSEIKHWKDGTIMNYTGSGGKITGDPNSGDAACFSKEPLLTPLPDRLCWCFWTSNQKQRLTGDIFESDLIWRFHLIASGTHLIRVHFPAPRKTNPAAQKISVSVSTSAARRGPWQFSSTLEPVGRIILCAPPGAGSQRRRAEARPAPPLMCQCYV